MKLKTLLLSCCLLFGAATIASAQSNDDQVFTIVQHIPKFNGDLNKYLAEHIHYPDSERVKGITGKVYVNFIVEKDGSISNVKVLRGVANGPGLSAEAIKVISGMPKWTPGEQNGKVVRVSFNLPINFQLQ